MQALRKAAVMRRLGRIVFLGLLMVAIGALASLPVGAATSTQAKTVKVKAGDNYFKPKKLTVTVGDKIVWTWIGTAIHDVKVKKGPQKFESEKQASGKYAQVLLEPGKYKIVCTLHPGMDMKLTVKAPPPPPTTTLPPPPAP